MIPTQTTALSCSRFSVLYEEHFAFLTMVRLHVRNGLRTRFRHGSSWSRVSRFIFFSVSLKHYRVRADREPRRPFLVGVLLERGYQESYAYIEDAGSFFSLRWQYDRGCRESLELFATRIAREGTIHPEMYVQEARIAWRMRFFP